MGDFQIGDRVTFKNQDFYSHYTGTVIGFIGRDSVAGAHSLISVNWDGIGIASYNGWRLKKIAPQKDKEHLEYYKAITEG